MAPAAPAAPVTTDPTAGSRPAPPRWAVELLAIVVAAAGPVVRSRDSVQSRDVLVIAVAVGAAALLTALPAPLGPLRLLVPVAAAAILLPTEGVLMAGWTAGALVASDWGVRGRSPWPGHRPEAPARAAVVAILLVTAWCAGPDHRPPMLVVGLVAAAVVVAGGGLVWGGRRIPAT